MRYPDNPIHSAPSVLDTLADEEWLCQLKMNGWRCQIEKTISGNMAFTSKRGTLLAVGDELRRELDCLLPNDTVLDSEWLCRRDQDQTKAEALVVFDVLRYDGGCFMATPCVERYDMLSDILELDPPVEPSCAHGLSIVYGRMVEYRRLFEESRLVTRCEGVVIKRCDSRYIGSRRESRANPAWYKMRWRAGADGNKVVA